MLPLLSLYMSFVIRGPVASTDFLAVKVFLITLPSFPGASCTVQGTAHCHMWTHAMRSRLPFPHIPFTSLSLSLSLSLSFSFSLSPCGSGGCSISVAKHCKINFLYECMWNSIHISWFNLSLCCHCVTRLPYPSRVRFKWLAVHSRVRVHRDSHGGPQRRRLSARSVWKASRKSRPSICSGSGASVRA